MADLQPDQRANMLDQLPEDDRLIVQRILDTNAIARCAPPCSNIPVMLSHCCLAGTQRHTVRHSRR
jgi:hypothetical protein